VGGEEHAQLLKSGVWEQVSFIQDQKGYTVFVGEQIFQDGADAHDHFGLFLGVALGTLTGKPLPAMALTIPLFTGVRVAFMWLRQYFLAPVTAIWGFSGNNPRALDWVLSQNMVDKLGHIIPFSTQLQLCPLLGPGKGENIAKLNIFTCYQANGMFQQSLYQPAARFWLFQGIETAIFVVLSAGLVWLTFWWLDRKLS
jgi:hypothetical protein